MGKSSAIIRELIGALKEELGDDEDEEFEQRAPEATSEVDLASSNRILDMDRTPAHSDVMTGEIYLEYGINPDIKKHMNRQLFGALRRNEARRKRVAAS